MGVITVSAELRNPKYRLFFFARSVSLMGDMMRPVIITAAVLSAGYGATGVGYALAAEMVPFAMFVLFGGALADRFTPKRMMVFADLLRFAAMGMLTALLALGTPPLWQILVLLALSGLGTALFQPGVASVVPRVSSDVQKGNALLGVSESMMGVLGPALAGVILAVAAPWAALALDAASFAVSGFLLLRLDLSDTPRREGSLLSGLGEGWREFSSRNWLWGTIVIWMVGGLLSRGPNQTLGASLIVTEFGASTFGAIMAIFGLGNVVGALIVLRTKPSRPLFAGAIAVFTFALSPLVVALGLSAPAIAAGYFIWGIGATFWVVLWHTTVQTQVPAHAVSRVHAYDVAGSLAVVPVGRALAGPVGELVGLRTVLYVAAATAVAVPAALLSMPAIRRLRRRDT
jgi:predicted MFS family arabinose efflux permease